MRSPSERRMSIIETLSERRSDSIDNLAFEFGVSRRTMRNDIEILSLSFPLYTIPGPRGGVFVEEGFRLGKRYLSNEQTELLMKLLPTLSDNDATVMKSILQEFGIPERKKKV